MCRPADGWGVRACVAALTVDSILPIPGGYLFKKNGSESGYVDFDQNFMPKAEVEAIEDVNNNRKVHHNNIQKMYHSKECYKRAKQFV